ncbi:hypothetical protein K474DRAFT_1337673 [Panus rudis PR-1116 ss-1]|nr:hypothetical protein K474DRAFT_1337673 [Panus rudis PR-1116 ss-1]
MPLAFLVYDTILTFPQEARCIWRRKLTGASLLYFLIRYITLLNMGIRVFGNQPLPSNVQVCTILRYVTIVIEILTVIAIAVFECLRVWAISGKSWWLTTTVLILVIITLAIDIYADSYSFTSILIKSSGPLSGCWQRQEAPIFS